MSPEQCTHPDGFSERGTPDDRWSECWLCGEQRTRPADPSRVTAMADEVRSVIRQKRASAPTDAEEQQ